MRARNVWLCPVYWLADWEQTNPEYLKKGAWKNVAKGRVVGLQLLPPLQTENPRDCLCADLRDAFSLPLASVVAQARRLKTHPELRSPWVEHFAATFAALFARVALPSNPVDFLK